MLSGKMYTDEYIRELQNRTGNDLIPEPEER
jgi:hypothetical protein